MKILPPKAALLPLSASIPSRSAECWAQHLPSERMDLGWWPPWVGVSALLTLLCSGKCSMQSSHCFALESSSGKGNELKDKGDLSGSNACGFSLPCFHHLLCCLCSVHLPSCLGCFCSLKHNRDVTLQNSPLKCVS